MINRSMLAVALAISFSTLAFAKDGVKTEDMAPAKDEMSQPLKTVACPTPCDFSVSSRSEKEVVSIVKAHAKKMHKMAMTDKQVHEMMKTGEESHNHQH